MKIFCILTALVLATANMAAEHLTDHAKLEGHENCPHFAGKKSECPYPGAHGNAKAEDCPSAADCPYYKEFKKDPQKMLDCPASKDCPHLQAGHHLSDDAKVFKHGDHHKSDYHNFKEDDKKAAKVHDKQVASKEAEEASEKKKFREEL